MPRGDIWVGDAVRAVRALGVDDPGPVLALLGLARRPAPAAAPVDDGVHIAPADGPRSPSRPAPSPSRDDPPVPSGGVVTALPAEPDDGEVPDPWAGVVPVRPAPEPTAPATPLPLLPLPAGRHVVAAAVATPRPGRRLDVRAAVRTLARGTPLRVLPFRPVPTVRRGVQVLLDDGEGIAPFRADRAQLVALVRDVVGVHAVEVVRFTDHVDDRYRPPEPGTPVLAVTDLGIAGEVSVDVGDPVARWSELAARLRAQGSDLTALVPYSPRRWPRALRGVLRAVTWDVTASVRAVRAVRAPTARVAPAVRTAAGDGIVADLATVRPGVVELAELLAPAVRVEPDLLRRVRLRATRLPVDVEADLWFSSLLRASGPGGFSFAVDVAAELRERLAARWADPDDRPSVELARTLMTQAHTRRSPPLLLEEAAAWHVVTGRTDALDVELAPAVAALAGPESASLRFWTRQAAPRLSDEARATASGWVLAQFGGLADESADPERLLGLPVESALRALPTEVLLLRHRGEAVELGDLEGSDTSSIEVPRTRPRLVEVSWSGGSERVAVPAGRRVVVPVGSGPVTVRTAAGHRFRLDARAAPDPVLACVAVDDERSGFLVAPDLVVTAASTVSTAWTALTDVRIGFAVAPAALVHQVGDVAVLRLAEPRSDGAPLPVDPAVPPLVVGARWTGSVHHRVLAEPVAGEIESVSVVDGRFAVLIDGARPEHGEYRGMPVVVDGRLHGMVLGYHTSHAVGVAAIAEALVGIPPRPHAVVRTGNGPVGEVGTWRDESFDDLDRLFGGTLWLVREDDGRLVLDSRVTGLRVSDREVVGVPTAVPPGIDVTELLRAHLDMSEEPDGAIHLLDDDEGRALEQALARASAPRPAPAAEVSADDLEALIDLQNAAALEVHTGFREVPYDVHGVMEAALGPDLFPEVRGQAEAVLLEAVNEVRRPLWRDLCASFGLPDDATFEGVARTVLGTAADRLEQVGPQLRGRGSMPVSVSCSDRTAEDLRSDGLDVHPGAFERTHGLPEPDDLAPYQLDGDAAAFARALRRMAAVPDSNGARTVADATAPQRLTAPVVDEAAGCGREVVSELLGGLDPWKRADGLRRTDYWRTARDVLAGVGAPGITTTTDLVGFVDGFQDLLVTALDAVARTTDERMTTHYSPGPAVRALVESAPVGSIVLSPDERVADAVVLRTSFARYAQLVRWAAPRLTAALRLAAAQAADAERERAARRVVAVCGAYVVEPSAALRLRVRNPAIDVDAVVSASAALREIGPGDVVVVVQDDPVGLATAEWSVDRGVVLAVLTDREAGDRLDGRRWDAVAARSRQVRTFTSPAHAQLLHGTGRWLLDHLDACGGRPALVVVADGSEGEVADMTARAGERGIPHEVVGR